MLWGQYEWSIYMKEEDVNEDLKVVWVKHLMSKCVELYWMAIQFRKLKSLTRSRQVEDTHKKIIDWVIE